MLTAIALIPILLLLVLIAVLEKPAYIAAPFSLVVTSFAALLIWKMEAIWLGASLLKGLYISIEIIFIVIGAFLLISVLKNGRAFFPLRSAISSVSKDVRVQTILLAWFFVAFIEGASGFGTPSMIVAPLMVALGFTPLSAVITTLIGDGVSVTFGALGVPVTIGIAGGVTSEQAVLLGSQFVRDTYVTASLIHVILGMFVPFIMLLIVSRIKTGSFIKAFSAWRIAIIGGLLFVIPSFLVAYYFGPELPSVLGSIIGGFIFIVLVKKKAFLPHDSWHFETDESSDQKYAWHMHGKAVVPYAIIIVLLLISRLNIFGAGGWLRSFIISSDGILGTSLQYSFAPLYSPGFFFLIASVAGFILYRLSYSHIKQVVDEVLIKVLKTFAALFGVLGIVQIMINTGNNFSGLPSFASQTINIFSSAGPLWPVFAPLVGMFGAFISGSSTVSNLMFSSVQVETAVALGLAPVIGLALQLIGSAAGNMIAVHNIIAAASVVHLGHAEGKVIKYNLIPALGYCLIAGILVFVILRVF